MSKVYLTYKRSPLDPSSNIPVSDETNWDGNDAVVYSNFRKEVLIPLSHLYNNINIYANSVHRTIQLSFANTAAAMDYHTKRGTVNAAATQALQTTRAEKVSQGIETPSKWTITLTDENGTITTLN